MRLLVLAALAGCGAPPAPAAPRPLADILGHKVIAPEPLARARPGMTVPELQAAVPGAVDAGVLGYRLPFDGSGVELYAHVETGHVQHLQVRILGRDAKARLIAAWGQPDAQPSADREPTWRDVTTGWRASLLGCAADEQPPSCLVELHRHRPLETMFDKVAPPGAFAQLRYDLLEADAKRLTGLPIEHYQLPSLDYEGATANIVAIKGRIRQIGFFVPPAAHDIMVAKWGPPRQTIDKVSQWVDDATGWTAFLTTEDRGDWMLEFFDVQPVTAVVDRMIALIGEGVDRLRTGHAELIDDQGFLRLPTVDLVTYDGDSGSMILIDDGGPPTLTLILKTKELVAGATQMVFDQLEARYGKPTLAKKTDKVHHRYGKHLDVIEYHDELFIETH